MTPLEDVMAGCIDARNVRKMLCSDIFRSSYPAKMIVVSALKVAKRTVRGFHTRHACDVEYWASITMYQSSVLRLQRVAEQEEAERVLNAKMIKTQAAARLKAAKARDKIESAKRKLEVRLISLRKGRRPIVL